MEIRVLGPLEIIDNGGPVAVGAAKPAALLGLLLVHANEPVSPEQLVDELWEQRPPRSAGSTLQTYISQLRKRLGGVVQTRSTGYCLQLESDVLDASRFRQHIDLIGRTDDRGPAWVSEQLREALGLWRGPAFADFAGASWAEPERAHLEGLRLIAIEDRVESRLALGEHARLVPELETLVVTHPLRERLWAHLMLALYRSRRQADALRTYRRLRAHLAEELGIEPSADLAQLERGILLHAPELDWQAPEPEKMVVVQTHEPPGLPTGVVTFLLTDVVGSTELWDTEPTHAADALAIHDEIVARSVRERGGVLLKPRGEGDSTFAVFARATDALHAAVAMQGALSEEKWPGGVVIAVRMALQTGEALERDGDYYGPTVNRAARLRSLAGGGEVLLSQSTADLVLDRLPSGVSLAELGTRELRGLRRAERLYRVSHEYAGEIDGHGDVATRVPLPPTLAPQASVFVGRSTLVERLGRTWQTAGRGQRRVVLLAGEPGIGKTRLATEVAQVVYRDDGVVLYGRCDEELGVAFQPFTEAFRHYVSFSSPATLHARCGGGLSELSRLLPELQDLIPGLPQPRTADAETERYELFQGIVSVLSGMSRSTPMLLVLDDLHWAAKPTLLLLRHIARAEKPMSLLVIGTYRHTEARTTSAIRDMLRDVASSPGVDELSLTGLSFDDIQDYLVGTTGSSDGHAAFARTLVRETRGNPLFLREIVRHLADHDLDLTHSYDEGAAQAIPNSVRDVIERRLVRLSPEARQVLVHAAVIGSNFDVRLLERLTRDTVENRHLLDALDEAIDAGILIEPEGSADTLEFTHDLIRHTIYTNLTTPRRTRLHKDVVDALESFGVVEDADERLPTLAYHTAQAAGLGLAGVAADYAQRAGRQALTRLAFEEAIEHLERGLRALELVPQVDLARRAQLLLTLGSARHLVGDQLGNRDAARRAADDARALGDGALLAEAAVLYARWAGLRADPEGTKLLADALELLGPDDPEARARLLSVAASDASFAGRTEQAERFATEALELARQSPASSTLWLALRSRTESLYGSPRVEDRVRLVEELMAIEEASADPIRSLEGLHDLLFAQAELGNLSTLDSYIDALEEWQPRSRVTVNSLWATVDSSADSLARVAVNASFRRSPSRFRAFRALLNGRWEEAETCSAKALDETPSDPDVYNGYAGQLVQLRREQGRIEELTPMLRDGLESSDAGDALAGAYRSALALSLTDANQLDEAGSHFEVLAAGEFGRLPRGVVWTGTLAMLTEVCAALGDRDRARLLHRLFAPHSGHLAIVGNLVVCLGAVDRYLGMLSSVLGDWDAAEAQFASGLALEASVGSPPLTARTQFWYGSMSLDQGPRAASERARLLLQRAAQEATTLGMPRLATQAEARLSGR